ncbi:low molecular weight phosphatase family protein [Mycolicibacterium sp.]|uniref:arsenate reductase/protein-tyrosine-phosphatase family protein n=1 Tax=Mycolicibacterium sp. TaxID=2320850 RepID=UPI003D1216D1
MLHLLFVCTGNICRSPLAERLAAAYSVQLDIPGLTTSSAGTRAVIAHPMHKNAALVLESLGGEPADFAARQLTSRIAAAADLILTMTRAHRDSVLELAPQKLRSTYTLTEAAQLASKTAATALSDLPALRPQINADAAPDIPDPIGQSEEVFIEVGTRIAELLPPILELCRPPEAR